MDIYISVDTIAQTGMKNTNISEWFLFQILSNLKCAKNHWCYLQENKTYMHCCLSICKWPCPKEKNQWKQSLSQNASMIKWKTGKSSDLLAIRKQRRLSGKNLLLSLWVEKRSGVSVLCCCRDVPNFYEGSWNAGMFQLGRPVTMAASCLWAAV